MKQQINNSSDHNPYFTPYSKTNYSYIKCALNCCKNYATKEIKETKKSMVIYVGTRKAFSPPQEKKVGRKGGRWEVGRIDKKES